jgi:hypothetical protein
VAYPVAIFAQGFSVASKSPPSVNDPGTFVSLHAGMSISLPTSKHGFQPVSFDSHIGKIEGDTYIWTMKEARFSIGFVEGKQDLAKLLGAKELIDKLRDDMVARANSLGGKLTNERDVSFKDYPGRELKVEFPDGILINRIYLRGARIYELTAALKGEQVNNQAAAVRVFDSFKILSGEEISEALRKKIAEATPDPLPQSPIAPGLRPDTEDAELKSSVKSVVNESENISEVGTRTKTSVEYYSERGYLTKTELFDWKGNVFDIVTYGFIDGERVTKRGTVRHEYNPPPMIVAATAGEPKPVYDPRYSSKFKNKYDTHGRRIERQTYNSAGKMFWRCSYSYNSNQRETLCYNPDQPYSKTISTFDEKGNELDQTDINPRDGSIKNKRSFTYEFDAKGNWIKKTSSQWVTKDGRSFYEPATVYHRTITYY